MLLDYLSTHSNDVLHYYTSDMCLYIYTDAAYLVVLGAKSRFESYFYSGFNSTKTASQSSQLNAPVHVLCKLLKYIVLSAA